MKYAVLDTNFILSCIRKKIDFFNDIPLMGLTIMIPTPVIKEIEKISVSSQKKLQFREEAALAIKLLEKKDFKKTGLDGKTVDYGIIKLARENHEYVIATLDRGIKTKITNKKLVIRGEKQLEIIS